LTLLAFLVILLLRLSKGKAMGVKCPKCQHENPEDTLFCGKCATRLLSPEGIEVTETLETAKEELTRGTTLANRYEIIEELGKGGMGRVYRVEDTKLKQEIALKLIKPEIAKDKKTIERFRNELKLAREISHRNVCRMYDLNEEKGTHYITMEYVRGEDLRSSIRRFGQLPIGKSISLAKQICEGLAEAHRLGVVHRDLKSNNIMIDKEGNVRIMDFGIARSLEAKGITGAGVMIGTPEYMSPEQVEGKEVDQRSDIYSLGIILYEMTTGRLPFEGDTPLAVAMKHKGDTAKYPQEFNPQIPDELSRAILKCLEKEKKDRYQSAEDVRSEMINIEKGIPTTDRVIPKKKPLTSREITVKLNMRKILVPILAVIAAIIIGMFLWRPWVPKQASKTALEKPSVAVLPFEDFSPQQDQDHLCRGIASELINRLNRLQDLWVPARASSFLFGGKDIDLNEVGNRLKVKTVLLGTLQKAGIKLRISVELVNVADKATIWQETYERDEGDIFDLQDEISLAILNKLKINLLGEDKTNFVKRYTGNHQAYDLYWKGRFFWEKRTEESIHAAIDYFNQSIAIDPEFALPYAGLSDCYLALPWYSPSSTLSVMKKAIESAQKALTIDNTLADAHASLAWLKMEFEYDWKGAEEEFIKAIDLNYNCSTAHHWYALLLAYLGRFDEAISEINIALEMDPLSLIINRNVGQVCFIARKYDQVIEAIQKTLELNSSFTYAHLWLGVSYFQKSMYDEALAEMRMERDLSKGQNPIVDVYLGIAYALMGQEAEAHRILNQIENRSQYDYISPVWLACLYHSLGEIDKSFEFLEKAYEERDVQLVYIKEHAWFDNFRSDPRFNELLKKMRLK
jgi:serine/threonine protein kinase/tetratricopeptide (TPR) repeat protein/ribosomal protein S27E